MTMRSVATKSAIMERAQFFHVRRLLSAMSSHEGRMLASLLFGAVVAVVVVRRGGVGVGAEAEAEEGDRSRLCAGSAPPPLASVPFSAMVAVVLRTTG
jgi:hypothetical protein